MREPDERTVPNDATAQKKNYHSPQLIVYGHIREITQALGNNGADDGVLNTKTSL